MPRHAVPASVTALAVLTASLVITPSGAATPGRYQVVHRMDAATEGYGPAGGLLLDDAGNGYVVNGNGGLGAGYGCGTLLRVAADGSVSEVHAFKAAVEGCHPAGRLWRDADGSLVGTTTNHAVKGYGAVWRFDPLRSAMTVLHAFDGTDGRGATSGVIRARDGNLYGTTYNGGVASYGNLFRLAPDGTFTTLYTFRKVDEAVGMYPGPVIEGPDGLLYGSTQTRYHDDGSRFPPPLPGAIWRSSTEGQLSVLHTLGGPGEGSEVGALAFDDSGAIVAGADSGGSDNGSIMRLTMDGGYTTLHVYAPYPGSLVGLVQQPLLPLPDGTLYGVTQLGGGDKDNNSFGTVFRLGLDGTYTTLHTFAGGKDGTRPAGGLARLPDGSLVGTTEFGGNGEAGGQGAGTMFRIAPQ